MLYTIITEYGVVDKDILNVNETSFRIRVSRSYKIVIKDKRKKAYIANPDNQSYITVVKCI
jgi:hypothetical protein